MRQDWISSAVHARLKDFSVSAGPLKMGFFSWNVDGQSPEAATNDLQINRLLEQVFDAMPDQDILVFQFQELIDLSNKWLGMRIITAGIVDRDHEDVTQRYHHWHALLVQAVDRRFPGHRLMCHRHLVGVSFSLQVQCQTLWLIRFCQLYLCVFAKSQVANRMKDCETSIVKTGLFDKSYGNKGSVLFRFVYEDSSFCIINCHLAAGEQRAQDRVRDISDILQEKGHFERPSASSAHAFVRGQGTEIADHEHCWFGGDLNFRVSLPREQVLDAVRRNALQELLPFDELNAELHNEANFVLHDFEEAHISFAPTYKYDQ